MVRIKRNRPQICEITLSNLKAISRKKNMVFLASKINKNAPIREFKPLNNECTNKLKRRVRYAKKKHLLYCQFGHPVTKSISCGVVVRQANQLYQQIDAGSLLHQGRITPLTSKEITWAKTAWRYFINNTDNETGLVNALDCYPMAPWTMADSLAALLSAHQLGLIEK